MRASYGGSHHIMSGGRYPALRAFGILYLVLAGFALLSGIGYAIYYGATANTNWLTRLFVAGQILGGAVLACVTLLVVAEAIKLFMDIERNTRLTAMAHGVRPDGSVMSSPMPAGTVVAPDSPTLVGDGMHTNRMSAYLDEETAEAALIRGH